MGIKDFLNGLKGNDNGDRFDANLTLIQFEGEAELELYLNEALRIDEAQKYTNECTAGNTFCLYNTNKSNLETVRFTDNIELRKGLKNTIVDSFRENNYLSTEIYHCSSKCKDRQCKEFDEDLYCDVRDYIYTMNKQLEQVSGAVMFTICYEDMNDGLEFEMFAVVPEDK